MLCIFLRISCLPLDCLQENNSPLNLCSFFNLFRLLKSLQNFHTNYTILLRHIIDDFNVGFLQLDLVNNND